MYMTFNILKLIGQQMHARMVHSHVSYNLSRNTPFLSPPTSQYIIMQQVKVAYHILTCSTTLFFRSVHLFAPPSNLVLNT